jgi:hypothetical protein
MNSGVRAVPPGLAANTFSGATIVVVPMPTLLPETVIGEGLTVVEVLVAAET